MHLSPFQCLIRVLKIERVLDCFMSCGKYCHSLEVQRHFYALGCRQYLVPKKYLSLFENIFVLCMLYAFLESSCVGEILC